MKPKDCKKCGPLCDKFITLSPYDIRPSLKLKNVIITSPCNAGHPADIFIEDYYAAFSYRMGYKKLKTLKSAINLLLKQNYITLEETILLTKYKNIISSSSSYTS